MTPSDQATRQDPSRFIEPGRTTAAEVGYRQRLEEYFSHSAGSNVEKLQNFAKYVPVQDMRRFLCRYEIFQRVLPVHGSIVECGVLMGGGLMTWAALSEIFEPVNHLRNIIGFDTFEGFTSVAAEDRTMTAAQGKVGGLAVDTFEDLRQAIALYDDNRLLKHIPKVKLVRGDVRTTAPQFLEQNPHTVVGLLWLDFDTFEPTVAALQHFVPRMPKGAIIAFDELNHEVWPGETVAVVNTLGLPTLRVQRFPWGSTVSFAVLE
jgi:hypothetical protein